MAYIIGQEVASGNNSFMGVVMALKPVRAAEQKRTESITPFIMFFLFLFFWPYLSNLFFFNFFV